MKANGDYHIAIYANRDLKAGEELFINYNYSDELKEKLFKGKLIKDKNVKEESQKIVEKRVMKQEHYDSSD